MSLDNYKPQFDNAYQEVFQKVLVAKPIMNTRFEKVLKFGASVERVIYDISGVRVRTVTRGSASTIDSVSDSSETLLVNLEKEAVFHISDGEVTQAGPLNPGEKIGGDIAIKVAADLDARCFAETRNALYSFDTGDLTTLTSNGTPITINSTTTPQMVTRMPAKLRYRNNQTMTNMAFVVDSYAAADIEQYLLGKQFSIVESVFKNGYAGPIATAEVYVSENLSADALLSIATQPTDGDTVTINGVVFTFKTTLGVTAGNVAIGGSADAARLNLSELINAPGTTDAGQVALSAADQLILTDTLKAVAVDSASANTLALSTTGGGRLIVSETLTDATDAWTYSYLNAYFGKKGAIDLVIQDLSPVDMRKTSDRRGTNVFSSYLAGLKTFADGAKKFLRVKIAA